MPCRIEAFGSRLRRLPLARNRTRAGSANLACCARMRVGFRFAQGISTPTGGIVAGLNDSEEKKKWTAWPGRIFGSILLRAAALAILTVLSWCTIYDRWTVESWQTPLTYLSDPVKCDVLGIAGGRSRRAGRPFLPVPIHQYPGTGGASHGELGRFPHHGKSRSSA